MKGEQRGHTAGAVRGVDPGAIADALEDWTYSTRPSAAAAAARHLREAFPGATVRRGTRRGEADVVVDGVGVRIATQLGPRFRQELALLTDRYEDLICYSPAVHRERPTVWIESAHRNRSIDFVSGSAEPADGDGTRAERSPLGAVASMALFSAVAIAIGAVFAASLGTVSTAGTGLTLPEWLFLGGAGAIALCVATAGYWLRRRPTFESLLARLAQ